MSKAPFAIGALAALAMVLMTGCAATAPRIEAHMEVTPIELRTIASRREELDGRWVEFDAYVYRWQGGDFLIAVPGETVTDPDGNRRTLCRGTDETNLPVLLSGEYGPLGRQAVQHAGRQPRVRIRGLFRDAVLRPPNNNIAGPWRGYFDEARILAVTGEYCDLD